MIRRLARSTLFTYTTLFRSIPNRRFYYERLLQEIARARRGNHALSLALVDLDLFKEINDEVGHRGGDQVLKFFSQFVRSEEHTSELQSQFHLVCRLLLEQKK